MNYFYSIRISRIAVVALLGSAIFVLAGCKRAKDDAAQPSGPLPVNVVTAIEKEVTEWDEFTGRMDAVESVEIRPRVSGYITEIRFRAGDLVKKDAPLFVIDPRPYQADLDRAIANLEQTEAQQKLAEIDFNRADQLRQRKVVSSEEFDQKAAALQQAKASVRGARASKDAAQLNVQFTEIKSPIDGRVNDARVTVGNLVQAGGAAENVLTTVVSVDPFYVFVDADENAVLKFLQQHSAGKRRSAREEKVPAYIQLANEQGFPHEGYLDFVENRMDPGTATLRLRGVFKSWDPLLSPGFFVRLRVASGPKISAVLIPDEVISSQQGVKFVFVAKPDKTIERRNIETGTIAEGLRIVRDGVKAGEDVVSTRLQMIQPGMKVQPIPSPPKSSASAPDPAPDAKPPK
jgi:membrane fusion protein, multidrug efflux system